MTLYRGPYGPRDTYRICGCPRFKYPSDWLDHDLWTHRYDRQAPVPASCVDCGGWLKYWDRECSRCADRYYQYFFHPNQRYFPNELCWSCVRTVDRSEPFKYWGLDTPRLEPNPILFPKIRSLAEIREALHRL